MFLQFSDLYDPEEILDLIEGSELWLEKVRHNSLITLFSVLNYSFFFLALADSMSWDPGDLNIFINLFLLIGDHQWLHYLRPNSYLLWTANHVFLLYQTGYSLQKARPRVIGASNFGLVSFCYLHFYHRFTVNQMNPLFEFKSIGHR